MKGNFISIITTLLVLILAIAATSGVVFVLWKTGNKVWTTISQVKNEKRHSLATSSILLCQELTTIKNEYSSVVSIKKSRIAGFAHSYSVVRFDGVIRAGIKDISLAKISLNDDAKTIEVILPQCEILENAITDIEIFDESKSVFVSVTTAEIMEEIKKSRDETKEAQIKAGILKDAQAQTIRAVQAVLSAAGFSKINVLFEQPLLPQN